MRVTVDGGTLCWFSWLKSNNIDETCINPPDYLTGDLDSIPENYLKKVEQRYPQLEIIKTMDQDETDFTKSLRVIQSKISESNIDVPIIIVLGDSSGRIDQIMANVNTLFKAKTIVPNSSVYLLGSDSFSWLLSEGYHKISIPVSLSRSKTWCSLVPIGSSSIATTTGLKWNLNSDVLEFGKMVSTSNTYSGDPVVTVLNSAPLLWSMGILPLVGNSKEQQTEDSVNVI
ncbi:thiamin pyrophosphokinase 1 isoform X2 [Agrilus planipennis]|nr:thiamin pyrophosphokinase 1 isoform X2 [Agrilus planipennis]